jgi:glycosyltransferase involved in cell wall biosynthesis
MGSRVIFIDNTNIANLNHRDIKNRAIGASEYQYYNLIGEFSKLNLDIICYNAIQHEETIGNVQYKNINNVATDTFFASDKIIIQRYCSLVASFIQNKVFVWFHDCAGSNFLTFPNSTCKDSLDTMFQRKNIHFIFNSESCKQMYFQYFLQQGIIFEENRYKVIYNILYEDDFREFKDAKYKIDKNTLVFGSAWCKGIHQIMDLFRHLVKLNTELKLILLSPGYDYSSHQDYKKQIETEFKEKVIILGPLDKKKYCEVIKTSLCVLSTTWFETFGCIFAESYYLGTPVIASHQSGAIKEIIDNRFIVDYNNPDIVLERIMELQQSSEKNNVHIQLDNKFLVEENMFLWKDFVLF